MLKCKSETDNRKVTQLQLLKSYVCNKKTHLADAFAIVNKCADTSRKQTYLFASLKYTDEANRISVLPKSNHKLIQHPLFLTTIMTQSCNS